MVKELPGEQCMQSPDVFATLQQGSSPSNKLQQMHLCTVGLVLLLRFAT